MNNIIYILLLTLSFAAANSFTITGKQKKIINHAKSLERSGLKDEAENVYTDLFNEFPHLKEALNPLSIILKNKNNLGKLDELIDLYQKTHSYSVKSQLETFEMLLWTGNSKWKNILEEIKIDESIYSTSWP